MALGFDITQPMSSKPPSANPYRIQPVRTGFWQGWRNAQRNSDSVRVIPQRQTYYYPAVPAIAYRGETLPIDGQADTTLREQVLQAAAERAQAIAPMTPAQAAGAASSSGVY